MIFIDMNQITIAMLMVESKGKPVFNPDLIRHMVVNNIRLTKLRHGATYGDLVLCYDAGESWRKGVFPHYKAARKAARKEDDFDWDSFFTLLHTIRMELAEFFPYRVMHVENCEADDVIAVLTSNLGEDGPHLIVSADNDFQQLQKYPWVKQYSPMAKAFVKCHDPTFYLFEHTIRGDVSDGVPNFLSDDDTFVNEEKRQKPIREKKILEWWASKIIPDLTEEQKKNLERNRVLIDFSRIPDNITGRIMDEYSKLVSGDRSKLMGYFMAKKMRNLIECVGEF
jgi:hypothetical protein